MKEKLFKILKSVWNYSILTAAAVLIASNVLTMYYVHNQLAYFEKGINVIGYSIDELKKEVRTYLVKEAQIIETMKTIIKEVKETKDKVADLQTIVDKVTKFINKNNPDNLAYRKDVLEYALCQVTIMIMNDTSHVQASGVTIKHNGKYYILSAGHMIENTTDKVSLWENGHKIADLQVVKVDHITDLLLLETIDEKIKPNIYTTVASEDPQKGENIYVVGNPIGIEDVLSEAKVQRIENIYFYFLDHSYFGSSGGGIYNMKGEVIGIISHMKVFDPNPIYMSKKMPLFVVHGATRTSKIIEFLIDIK